MPKLIQITKLNINIITVAFPIFRVSSTLLISSDESYLIENVNGGHVNGLSRRGNGGNGGCVHCTFRSSSLFEYPVLAATNITAGHHGPRAQSLYFFGRREFPFEHILCTWKFPKSSGYPQLSSGIFHEIKINKPSSYWGPPLFLETFISSI